MWTAILSKIGLPVLFVAAGSVGGMVLQTKIQKKPEPVDYVKIDKMIRSTINEAFENHPAPAVSIQPFEADQLKKVKEFNYNPTFSGNITIATDSAALNKAIANAIAKAFEKQYPTKSKIR